MKQPYIISIFCFFLLMGCISKEQRETRRIKKNLELIQKARDKSIDAASVPGRWPRGPLHNGDVISASFVRTIASDIGKLGLNANSNNPNQSIIYDDDKGTLDFGNGEVILVPPVGESVEVPYAIFKRYEATAPASFWEPFAIEPESSKLTNQRAKRAVQRFAFASSVPSTGLLVATRGGAVSVSGVQEFPQQSSARADVKLYTFTFNNTNTGEEETYSGVAEAYFTRYTDARWVLTGLHIRDKPVRGNSMLMENMSFSPNIEAR